MSDTARIFLESAGLEAVGRRRRALIAAHPELRALIGPSPLSALLLLAFVAAQLAIAYALRAQPLWLVAAAAIAAGALLAANLTAMIHEAAHDLIFARRAANRAIALVANLPLVIPAAMPFFFYHKWHHVMIGDYHMDVGIPTVAEARWVGNRAWRKALWLALFPLFQWWRTHKFRPPGRYWDRWMVANHAVQAAAAMLIVGAWGWHAAAYLLLSYALSAGFHPVGTRVVQEHFVIEPGQETNNLESATSVMECHFGYHAQHHDLPRVAWHRLPQIRRVAPEFYAETPVLRSRLMLLVSFIADPRWDARHHAVLTGGEGG